MAVVREQKCGEKTEAVRGGGDGGGGGREMGSSGQREVLSFSVI